MLRHFIHCPFELNNAVIKFTLTTSLIVTHLHMTFKLLPSY